MADGTDRPTYAPRARPRQKNPRQTMKRREIYFIQAETLGLIKIGVANFAAERLAALQTGSPDRLKLLGVVFCDNFGETERWFHGEFWQARSHGEWYHPTAALLAHIAEHAKPPRTQAEADADLEREWDVALGLTA